MMKDHSLSIKFECEFERILKINFIHMKIKLAIIINLILFYNCYAQQDDSTRVTIFDLQEVTIYGRQGLSILSSINKKDEFHVCGKGKTSLVSGVPVDKNLSYRIYAIEFFFNYQWRGFENEGFLIRPLILRAKDGLPGITYLTDRTEYFVGKKINERIYIDLSGYGLQISDVNLFFVGIEFVDAKGHGKFEDFNVTMVDNKKQNRISFLKGMCPECKYEFLNVGAKNSVSLKYNIYYK